VKYENSGVKITATIAVVMTVPMQNGRVGGRRFGGDGDSDEVIRLSSTGHKENGSDCGGWDIRVG
jgi:hypothetical protein